MAILAGTGVFAAPAAQNPPQAMDSERSQVLQKLKREHYFRNASCTEVSDFVLKKIGLPPLWRPGLIKGRRGSVSRPPKPVEPPVFSDEITSKGKSPIKVQIRTRALGPKQWHLHLNRSGEVRLKESMTPVSLDSDFTFGIPAPGRCELTSVSFKMKNRPSDKSLTPEQVTIRECLDMFFVVPKNPSVELKWIMSDCAMTLKYSPEAESGALTNAASPPRGRQAPSGHRSR